MPKKYDFAADAAEKAKAATKIGSKLKSFGKKKTMKKENC